MKRRLESVASTGSSASSGFIEDKSYCDSEEEEEGKSQARLASLQPPHSSLLPTCPSCCPPSSPPPPLTSAPPLLPRNESSHQIVFQSESDGTFPPPVQQYNQCSRSDCHPTESGEASVYFLSWPRLLHSSLPWAQHVSLVVSNVLFWVWLAVYSGGSGRAPCEFLLQHAASITTRFTWHLKNRRACNIFFYHSSIKNVSKTECGGDMYVSGWILKMACCSPGPLQFLPWETLVLHLIWFIWQVWRAADNISKH